MSTIGDGCVPAGGDSSTCAAAASQSPRLSVSFSARKPRKPRSIRCEYFE